MSFKNNYWRKPRVMVGGAATVRYVICKVCGKSIGGAITGVDSEQVAREMRYVAREHRKASGHEAFFFADGLRQDGRLRRLS